MEVPHKTKNRTTIWSSNPTPGHISRQNCNSERYMYTYAHSSTVHDNQEMKTTWITSTDRWVDMEDVVHIYREILLSNKKEWHNAIRRNMDANTNYQTQSERGRQILHDITYAESKIWHKWTYLWDRNRIGDIESRLVLRGTRVGAGRVSSVGSAHANGDTQNG